MAEEKKTGEKKHITGARIAKEIRQYKKDALLSPMYTTLCVVLEILIPYLTASIIDKGIAVGDMEHVAKIGSLMAVMAVLAMFCGMRAGIHSACLLYTSDFRHAESRQRTHGSNPHPPGREPRSLHPLFPSALRMEKFIFFR